MAESLGPLHSLGGKALLGNMERSDEEGAPVARELRPNNLKWKKVTRAIMNEDCTFEDVYQRVHSNNVAGVAFDFDALTTEEKEFLIMRATPLSVATKDFAVQFASSLSGDAEFKLSKPVHACDDFLSHAWATERLSKWCALVYTYNFKAATVAWLFMHIVGVSLCAAIAPADRSTIGFGYRLTCYMVTVLLPVLVQAYILLYGLGPFLRPEPTVFLDKVCINQNHVGLKTLGINGLETFLKYSKRMVLLYDVQTYKRLWCAFESAMFSRYADIKNFVLCPCSTARFAIYMLVLTQILVLGGIPLSVMAFDARRWDPAEFFRAFESRDHFILWFNVFGVVMTPVYFAMAWLLRNRCREITTIQKSLETFRMEDTQCYDPNDRKLVEARIAEVWGKTEHFNKFVQEQLAKEMTNTIGAADLPPLWLDLAMCWPWIPFFTYAGLIQTSNQIPFWQYTTSAIGSITFMWPLFIAMWNFFAFKIYNLFDATHPRLTVFLIGIWSIANCLFGACVDREFAFFAYGLPLWQCAPLLIVFFTSHAGVTYYLTHVERRTYRGEMTWTVKGIIAFYWIACALLFNPKPTSMGCEHWTCIWPHPPL